MAKKTAVKSLREVEGLVRDLLEAGLDDRPLLERLEALSREPAFAGLTWLWGPPLHGRSRALFRPFILQHFSAWQWKKRGRWAWVEWKGEAGERLEAWWSDVDRADDVELFRRLSRWRLTPPKRWHVDSARWCALLVERFRAAPTAAARAIVLEKFDDRFELDEASALALYAIDRCAGGAFILKHLPPAWLRRSLWERLGAGAEEAGDVDFRFQLYRRQCPLKRWEKDVLEAARTIHDSGALSEELERRHPEGYGLDLGGTLYKLLEERGQDVLSYVLRHLRQVWSHWYRSGYDRLLELARQRHWLDLWAALVRTCARHKEFNREVRRLLDDATLPPGETRRRLALIAGVSRELNLRGLGLAMVHSLSDATACALYGRFPELLRGAYKPHVEPTWGEAYPKLIEAAITARDEPLIDFLTSRFVTRQPHGHPGTKDLVRGAERLSRYYEPLKETEDFPRRAAAVLTQVPAYTIFSYDRLIRTNRLARLFFERSARAYLSHPGGLSDLVEASEIHVQALAYRILALDDDRARELGLDMLDVIQGTLFRPLHRTTRLAAFGALSNAAAGSEDAARRILSRAREAMDLPDVRYPKEQLVGLIGRILHHHPGLRLATERPIVYEHAEAAS